MTYCRDGDECELAVIAVLERHRGTGTALLEALLAAAAGCDQIWVVTTNDKFGIPLRDELELVLPLE